MKKFFTFTFLTLIVLGAMAAFFGYKAFKGSAVDEKHSLYIYPDCTYEQLADSVKTHSRHNWAFDL